METIRQSVKSEMIAVFMGYSTNKEGAYLMGEKEPQFYGSNHSEWCSNTGIEYDFTNPLDCEKALIMGWHYWNISPNNLQYQRSWNWLMPVVSKILIGSYPLNGVKRMKEVQNSLISCSIEKTFESVCNFIEWYNKN